MHANKVAIKNHFTQFGKIKCVTFPICANKKALTKGYCFVEYMETCSTLAALAVKHKVRDTPAVQANLQLKDFSFFEICAMG